MKALPRDNRPRERNRAGRDILGLRLREPSGRPNVVLGNLAPVPGCPDPLASPGADPGSRGTSLRRMATSPPIPPAPPAGLGRDAPAPPMGRVLVG